MIELAAVLICLALFAAAPALVIGAAIGWILGGVVGAFIGGILGPIVQSRG
jgi:membrane protein YqaA with SNARE-associated domain